MRKVDKNVIIITLITIIFSLFLMKHLIGYKFTIEDTIGPGIYPLTILILIILLPNRNIKSYLRMHREVSKACLLRA